MGTDDTKLAVAQDQVVQVPSLPDTQIVVASFPTCAPPALFNYWIAPELLRQWRPPVAIIEPRAGGSYHLSWPSMNWHLRGEYMVYAPGHHLAFTWRWDHDPADRPTREVALTFAPLGDGGTELAVTHGRYTLAPADQEERQSHLEGWTAFLGKLRQEVA